MIVIDLDHEKGALCMWHGGQEWFQLAMLESVPLSP